MDLKTYMERHPMTEDEAEDLKRRQKLQSESVHAHEQKAENRRSALELKAACMDSLRQGTPAEFVLLQAMQCIGNLTNDPKYGAEAARILRNVYPDIEQEAVFTDSLQESRRNLDELFEKYCSRQEKQIDGIIHQLGIITAAATKCRQAMDDLAEVRAQKPSEP